MKNLDEQMLDAALNGDLATVEKLVSEGADINFKNQWGTTAVFSAAWEGNIEALDLFYSLGADITFEQTNLLCNAAFNGKIESVKWLLEKEKKRILLLPIQAKTPCIIRSAKQVKWRKELKL